MLFSKKKIKTKKIVLIAAIILSLFLLTFELLSRLPCANIFKNIESPCYDLTKKYVEPKLGYFPLSFPVMKTVNFSDLNHPEFFASFKGRTFYVPISEVKANGIACSNYAFVAQELPGKAKKYVTIHENIHLEGEYNETRTNYLATRFEPVGMFETVWFSLSYGVKQLEVKKLPCQTGRLWVIFKMYFLNIYPQMDN